MGQMECTKHYRAEKDLSRLVQGESRTENKSAMPVHHWRVSTLPDAGPPTLPHPKAPTTA